jgi:hypothetical protein
MLSAPLSRSECYIPARASKKGVLVSRAPQLIVEPTRPFAVYSQNPLVPPAQRIGIHGTDETLLKALALFLISPFAQWHQFFTSSQWGVSVSTTTINDIEVLPIPLPTKVNDDVRELADLYDRILSATQTLFQDPEALIAEAQLRIFHLLNLRPHERDLIEGFFAGPYECVQGKFPVDAVNPATPADIRKYCRTLCRELDEHLQERGVRHQITIVLDDKQAVLTIKGKRTKEAIEPAIQKSRRAQTDVLKRIKARLRRKHSQRVYFEKSLSFYKRGRVFFFKPRRRIEWNVRQAVLDADDLIAELLSDHD